LIRRWLSPIAIRLLLFNVLLVFLPVAGSFSVSGRIVIDPVTHTFRFQAVTAPDADARRIDPQLDAAHVRYYEFVGDLLKTTVKDAKGATTATATWKRAS